MPVSRAILGERPVPAETATTIPARIKLTDVLADVLIGAGMTCTVTLEKAERLQIAGEASGSCWRHFLAFWSGVASHEFSG
jgi:hypothetical protein